MAILSDGDRTRACGDYMREVSTLREVVAIDKNALRAALNAIDQWLEDNKASFNSALPPAARTNLTASQKARLLTLVVRQRFASGA